MIDNFAVMNDRRKLTCKYIDLVPKDYKANLIYRRDILTMCQNDKEAAKDIYAMCARDILFYVNTFGWTYDPRRIDEPLKMETPFLTYDFQDDAIVETIHSILDGKDLFTEKSRDMGASWIYLTAIKWMWHFHDMNSFLMISRNEDYVDKSGDPKSLFWKIDYLLSKDPKWLIPKFTRNKLHLLNENTGSTIEGESSTGRAGRGGRFSAILLDEFAAQSEGMAVLSATADATNCRIFNSTYEGAGNAFYEVSRWPNIKKLTFHWSQHPDKNNGLYRVNKDKSIYIIDKKWHAENPFYEFVKEHGYFKGLHSPWYDKECKRRTPQEIKEQLDIDPHGSGATFFDYKKLDDIIDNVCREPISVGTLRFNLNHPDREQEFIQDRGGKLSLWIPVDLNGNPLKKYNCIFGTDISAGTGASNSCISVWDKYTKEKICQFVNSNILPYQLAKLSIALSYWLNPDNEAFQIWDAQGPGREFGKTLLDFDYQNIYYKTRDDDINKKESTIPGFFATTDSKKLLLGTYRRMLELDDIKNYSQRAMMECREYIYDKSGNPKHSRQIRIDDPGGARDNHGDITYADALACKAINEYFMNYFDGEIEIEEPEIEYNSPEWRRIEYKKSLRKDKGWD